ncbi:MAG: glycosyltransferase family 4 protein [Planctomycetota bacterium]
MRIALNIDHYYPSKGGAEAYLQRLIDRLTADGHQVTIVARDFEKGLDGPAKQERVPCPSWPRLLREMVFARRSERLLRTSRADVVFGIRHLRYGHLYQPHGGVHAAAIDALIRAGSPAPWVQALRRLGKTLSPKQIFFRHLERRLVRGKERPLIAALSERVRQDFAHYHAIPPHEIALLPNAIDTEHFRPGPDRRVDRIRLRARHDLPETGLLLLFVGHHFRLKGLGELIEALPTMVAAGLDPWVLVVGRGRERAYRERTRQLDVEERVRFAGFVRRVESYYHGADVLVHPTWYDPCSTVVLEALACGLPVVTTALNGAAELMRSGEHGFVVNDPQDRSGLVEALRELAHEETRERFSAAAAIHARRFDFEAHYDGFLELLELARSMRPETSRAPTGRRA